MCDQIKECVTRCVHEPEKMSAKDYVIVALLVTMMIFVVTWLSRIVFRKRRRKRAHVDKGRDATGADTETDADGTDAEQTDDGAGKGGKED